YIKPSHLTMHATTTNALRVIDPNQPWKKHQVDMKSLQEEIRQLKEKLTESQNANDKLNDLNLKLWNDLKQLGDYVNTLKKTIEDLQTKLNQQNELSFSSSSLKCVWNPMNGYGSGPKLTGLRLR
ncbi:unnamed protein product, partial [Rotaria sordida]